MNGKPWTHADEFALRAMYADNPTADIAKILGRTKSQVYRKAHQLGLAKSEEFLQSTLSGRIQRGRTDPRMVATQIKPGSTPWNKGTHFVAGGRSAETRFKTGRKPQESRNYRPIGSLRISKDGYLERKITDDRALSPARRWVALHRLVWEAERGPIPSGHIVVFRLGLHTTVPEDVTVERLECITRVENMRRNSVHTRLPPEVRQLAQLKGAITRQVNRIAKEQNQ